jgi:hypothetical protein
VGPDRFAVDEDVLHARCGPEWVVVGRMVGEPAGANDAEVGGRSGDDPAAAAKERATPRAAASSIPASRSAGVAHRWLAWTRTPARAPTSTSSASPARTVGP